MPRDAEATRARLVDAAIKEFAQFGIAGGRVDRIAQEAGANKAQIYHYFGSKDQMFDAAFGAIVTKVVSETPIDVQDLPGYAANLADLYNRHPEILRMATWHRLERPGGTTIPLAKENTRGKINAVRAAQENGILPNHYPAEVLLALVLNIATTWAAAGPEISDTLPASTRRQHITDVVRRLLAS